MKHVVESGDFFFFCVFAWYNDRGDLQSYRGESSTEDDEDVVVVVSGALWVRNIFFLSLSLSRVFFNLSRLSLSLSLGLSLSLSPPIERPRKPTKKKDARTSFFFFFFFTFFFFLLARARIKRREEKEEDFSENFTRFVLGEKKGTLSRPNLEF